MNMKKTSILAMIVGIILFLLIHQTNAFESRSVNIWSDGTRLSGDLFYPKGSKAGDKLPAIILCHGWAGLRSQLNRDYAPVFARAGYAVLTFDYRGWGGSDSRLVIIGEMPKPDEKGEVTVRAQAIRELVDPKDQTEDIINCVHFMSGESMVDPERIGLWGTSFGGGHVVYVAAHDNRVKCIVSQVGSLHRRWVPKERAYKQAIQRARGEIDPVPQGVDKNPRLRGTAYLSRMMDNHPIDYANLLKIPVLIIDAENEELIKISENGRYLYDTIKKKVPAKYEVTPGITHFEIYSKGRMQATQLAIEWFDKYLKKK
jgi:hypothetical protein